MITRPNIWSSKSPNVKPFDYCAWIVVEGEINEFPHKAKDSLKAAVLRVMFNMIQGHLIQACQRFRSRREAIVEAEYGFIKKKNVKNDSVFYACNFFSIIK